MRACTAELLLPEEKDAITAWVTFMQLWEARDILR